MSREPAGAKGGFAAPVAAATTDRHPVVAVAGGIGFREQNPGAAGGVESFPAAKGFHGPALGRGVPAPAKPFRVPSWPGGRETGGAGSGDPVLRNCSLPLETPARRLCLQTAGRLFLRNAKKSSF